MRSRHFLQPSVLVVALLGWAAPACADEVADPTAPPPALRVVARPVATTPAADLNLQSVLTGNGRRVAIIDGRTVREGERVGDLRVRRIDARQVVLQRLDPPGQVVLSLATVPVRSTASLQPQAD